MRYVIYIDKIWLMDFIISTYLLLLVRKNYGLKSSLTRLLLCAAAGAAAFVFLLLLPGAGFFVKLLLQAVCVEYLVLRAAFSFRTKEMVVRSYACMGGYGLYFGGVLCFISGYLPGIKENLNLWKALLVVTAAAGFLYLYLHFRRKRGDGILTVKLDFYGEVYSCKGLADTGNSLYEPYGNRPVSILAGQETEVLLERVPTEKHYLVPFHSIGKKRGLLTAVELPWMEVEDGKESLVFRKVVVALSGEELTKKGNYQMILHPEHVRQEE